ncbi:MAG: DUF4935 domain-containing protein [Clostridia bacterium]|nr:DUF4935 domain-containing protein [Clostridia bacterium]
MSEKKAFVFDTNFIIQNQRLDEVVKNLEKDFSVYVTQVSIDERIAQQCRELKKEYDEIESLKSKCAHFASVKIKITFDKACSFYKDGIQGKYKDLFQDRIIPFEKTGDILNTVIDRANKKIPPFSDAKDASDKGFKDCLLWISLITYFKSNGENEIVFVTDDKSAFRSKADFLCKEFKDETDKTIEFKPNAFYKDYLLEKNPPVEEPAVAPAPENLELIRDEIEETIKNLCVIESVDFWGDPEITQTFVTSQLLDKEYTKLIFDCLQANLKSHIFEKTIPASTVFDFDGRISNREANISIKNLEKALTLYEKINSKYPEYIGQFFEAAARILNENYIPTPNSSDSDDLQF